MKLKCRKCREYLLDSCALVNSHGDPISDISAVDSNCVEDQNEPLWNVNYDSAPDWMKNCFHQGNWLKGKITCPKCEGRVGSYNFVQPRKCACGNSVAQPVWLMKSRIDASIPLQLPHSKPAVTDETWTVIKASVPDQLSPQQSKLMDLDLHNQSISCQNSFDSFERMQNLSKSQETYGDFSSSESEEAPTENFSGNVSRSKEQHEKLINRCRNKLKKQNESNQEESKVSTPSLPFRQHMLYLFDHLKLFIEVHKHQEILKKLKEKLLEEYKCPICLVLCVTPTQCFPCNHIFCRLCLAQISEFAEENAICPLCREVIRTTKVAKDLDNFLKNTFPFETRKRKEDQDENKQTSFFDKSSSSM